MPGTIKDPRMNPGQEKDYGIVFMEGPFKVGSQTYQTGHYYYKKQNNSNNLSNSHFYPQGFPVEVKGKDSYNQDNKQDEISRDLLEYPNLNASLALKLDFRWDPKDEEDIGLFDSQFPMVAYLHSVISDTVKGLPIIIPPGREYKYNRREGKIE